MIVFEQRAAIVLYNFLKSIEDQRGTFLLPANICPIVPETLLKAGVKIEWVDIEPDSWLINEAEVKRRLKRWPAKYAGILFLRTYGLMDQREKFFQQIKALNDKLWIIDDRCLAKPDTSPEIKTEADLVLYSTGYSKFIDLGWGGWGVINNARLKYQAYESGSKLRASWREYKQMIDKQLGRVERLKQKINKVYQARLPKKIQLPDEYQQWRFNILVPDKEALLEKIFAQGLFASSHYAPLTGAFGSGKAPVAEHLYSQVINLFNDFRFDVNKAKQLTRIINRHLLEAKR